MALGTGQRQRCMPYKTRQRTDIYLRDQNLPELPDFVETELVRPDADHTP